LFPLSFSRRGGRYFREGLRPYIKYIPPLLETERGTKGVRLINSNGGL